MHNYHVLFIGFLIPLIPSLFFLSKSIVYGVHPALALGMCSCAVSSCQTLFCFKPLTPSFSETSHFHIYVFLLPHAHPSFSFFSSCSISFTHLMPSLLKAIWSFTRLLPSLLKAIWVFHLSSPHCLSPVHSLTPLISLSPFTRCQHFVLPPLLLPCLSSSSLSSCLHLHTMLVSYLLAYAAIRNCLLCPDCCNTDESVSYCI